MLEILYPYKEGSELIIQILILIAVYLGLITLKFQKKEVHFSTVKKCIDNHRDILRNQQRCKTNPNEVNEQLILVRDHLGLVNEELFYMKSDYLPRKLSKDWLMHMINFIPLYKGDDQKNPLNEISIKRSKELGPFVNSSSSNSNNYETYLLTAEESFGRINQVFRISNKRYKKLFGNTKSLNFNDSETKKKIVKALWHNIKR
jgi:hypothetical protein